MSALGSSDHLTVALKDGVGGEFVLGVFRLDRLLVHGRAGLVNAPHPLPGVRGGEVGVLELLAECAGGRGNNMVSLQSVEETASEVETAEA